MWFIVIMMVAIVQFFILAVIYASRYKKVPPDKAMIIYGGKGQRGKDYDIVIGGGRFIVPVFNAYAIMPLDARSAKLSLNKVLVDNKGEKKRADLEIVAVYKISNEEKLVRKAAGALLHKTDAELNKITEEIVTATSCSALRDLKASVLEDKPEEVAKALKKAADLELNKIGMELKTLKISSVTVLSKP